MMSVEQKQIEALKDLCQKAGITDADIAACAPQCKLRTSQWYAGVELYCVVDPGIRSHKSSKWLSGRLIPVFFKNLVDKSSYMYTHCLWEFSLSSFRALWRLPSYQPWCDRVSQVEWKFRCRYVKLRHIGMNFRVNNCIMMHYKTYIR